MELGDIWSVLKSFSLSEANRPVRMRLAHGRGMLDDVLMVQRVEGKESVCGGLEYRLFCVSPTAGLPLKDFIALPVEIQFVTDQGALHNVCGLVSRVQAGQSDGSLATYLLVVQDALSFLELRTNTAVFLDKTALDITEILLDQWHARNTVLSRAFELDLSKIKGEYSKRPFVQQFNESDAAFLRRIWARDGLCWYFESGPASNRAKGRDDTPVHRLVLFDKTSLLSPHPDGTIRFHRDAATEQRDSITSWTALHQIRSGMVNQASWDYAAVRNTTGQGLTHVDHGTTGKALSACLDDYLIDVPRPQNVQSDYQKCAELRMDRHDFEARCFVAESGWRHALLARPFVLDNHADHAPAQVAERTFVAVELRIEAENNLPKPLDGELRQRFVSDGWLHQTATSVMEESPTRYSNRLTCVQKNTPITPDYDPRRDLPRTYTHTALVVGPAGEEVHCDEQGRVKVRFTGTRPEDHAHAGGAGANDTDVDSYWIRVSAKWAGEGWGIQSLPRVNHEVVIDYLMGDPDQPIITDSVYNGNHPQPAFSHVGSLPGNRYVSGTKSKEIGGSRCNQLRYDDTQDQISTQLASEHGHSQLNLGYLTHPRTEGKGDARGEGVELRTDQHLALRATKGALLSVWSQLEAKGDQLSRDETLDMIDALVLTARQLGKYAVEHQGGAQDEAGRVDLQKAIQGMESGTNTQGEGTAAPAAAPILLTAPGGIGLTTTKTLLHYAGVNLDYVAQHHIQFTAGENWILNAGKGVSIFAQGEGIRYIAHQGKMLLQSQHDDTHLISGKNMIFEAAESLILKAKRVEISVEGQSHIVLDGGILLGTGGSIQQKAASFAHSGPATMSPALPSFPAPKGFCLECLKKAMEAGGPVAALK